MHSEGGKKKPSILDPINEIIPNRLYLGNLKSAEDEGILNDNGITHIVQVLQNEWKLYEDKIKYLSISADDSPTFPISKYFDTTYQYIEKSLNESPQNAVLVHCSAGASRSATIVISYLMKKNQWKLEQALQFVEERRPITSPNEGFFEQLQQLEKSIFSQTSP